MNEKDKEALSRQQEQLSKKRRTTKKEQLSAGQLDNGQRTIEVQQALQVRAQEAGLAIADNFHAASILYAMQYIKQGEHGERTKRLLDMFGGEELFPLEDWAILQSPEMLLLPSASIGLSTSPWSAESQEVAVEGA
jgi:hypothetical protein